MGQWFKSLYKVEKQKISLLWVIVELVNLKQFEQIKVYGAAYIRDLITVYDDMGLLSLDEKGTVKTSGTEIGAFVRLMI